MARTKGRFNAIGAPVPAAAEAPAKIYHTALYARLSVENSERKSNSIDSQLDIMRAHVKKHPELADYHEYTDSGFSGTNFERPAFSKMMEDVRNGKINCILVKDLSRFGRDYLETTNYIEIILPFLGVRFISVNDHFDTAAADNGNKQLEVALKNLVNDMYAKDISKRISVSRHQEMERGRFTGSNAPYGYVVDKDDPLRHFLIDEPAAEVVRDIYHMAAEGMSLREISIQLQERNLSIPGQYLKTGHLYQEEGDPVRIWHVGTLGNILRSQAYIGNLVHGRRRARLCENEKQHFTDRDEWIITENAHEPIIDRETYEKVRKLFAKKVEDSRFSSDRGKDIPVKDDKYHGLLLCGSCGKRLQMASSIRERDGQLYRVYFYQCHNSYDKSHPGFCQTHIMEWMLDKIVYASMKAQIEAAVGSEDAIAFCEETFAEKLKPLERALKKAKERIAKAEYADSIHYEDYVTGAVSRQKLEELQAESAVKIEKLKDCLSEAEEKYRTRKKELDGVLASVKDVYRMNCQGEITQEILQLMVDRILVYPDAHVEIQWHFTEWFSAVSETYGKGTKS